MDTHDIVVLIGHLVGEISFNFISKFCQDFNCTSYFIVIVPPILSKIFKIFFFNGYGHIHILHIVTFIREFSLMLYNDKY